jgi:hypothetical protein
MNLFVKSPGRQWNAHDSDIKEMFGLDRKAKWPAAGMPAREIQGIKCWVGPLVGGRRAPHRAMAECPACGKEVSIGRLRQHSKIHEVK